MPSPIITASEVESLRDGDLQARIDAAESRVRALCGWHITPPQQDTFTVSACGERALMLPSLMVTAVDSVTVDGTALDVADYSWTSFGAVTRSPSAAWCDRPGWWGDVVVSFTHGFTSAPEVGEVIATLALRAMDNAQSASRVQAGPFAATFDAGSGLTADDLDKLAPYRLPSRP